MRPSGFTRLQATSRACRGSPNPTTSISYRPPSHSVDHLVVGGGIVGLSIAANLTSNYPTKSTYLIERHSKIGQETSSRNSEVVHGGIYYPIDSLKTRLCVTGRQMVYERCERLGIPYKKAGKLVVATTRKQIMYLDELHTHTQHDKLSSFPLPAWPGTNPSSSSRENIGVPTSFLSPDEAINMEPDLGPNVMAAMYSPESGVVDSHALMESLEAEINGDVPAGPGGGEGGAGSVVLGTQVVRIDPYRDESGGKASGSSTGWVVQTRTEGSDEVDSVLARVVILAAGLNCVHLLNPLLPERERLRAYYVKGNYLSYKGPGVGSVKHLIYPCPAAGLSGLGTHLTVDMAGNIKFGPDVEDLGTGEMSDGQPNPDPDWWEKALTASPHRLEEMAKAVQDYLPSIDPSSLTPDYAGIRPNLSPAGGSFTDFHISYDPANRPGLIALAGFNSPGLTSALSTAVEVEGLIRRDVWGKGSAGGRNRSVSEVGGGWFDGWA